LGSLNPLYIYIYYIHIYTYRHVGGGSRAPRPHARHLAWPGAQISEEGPALKKKSNRPSTADAEDKYYELFRGQLGSMPYAHDAI